ncbi:hypothetical protein I7I53_07514 [Histoplasma capsulatum var. duboisii H88]|uniref:Uncharacterized protein n=1 Tax=Ajellomyces capsulatus (strain H88) TaxID=544711 RepID=A0A8A1LD80_AJEC8|nr:hypothetical protein I7I53_07514 [Histoplasma capsulatum var. duboisii H88]
MIIALGFPRNFFLPPISFFFSVSGLFLSQQKLLSGLAMPFSAHCPELVFLFFPFFFLRYHITMMIKCRTALYFCKNNNSRSTRKNGAPCEVLFRKAPGQALHIPVQLSKAYPVYEQIIYQIMHGNANLFSGAAGILLRRPKVPHEPLTAFINI